MSSISRRRNGLMALSVIGGLLSWVRFQTRNLKTGRLLSATPRLSTNYRESGLVLRRISPTPVRPGDSLLSDHIAGVQLVEWECLLLPEGVRKRPNVIGECPAI